MGKKFNNIDDLFRSELGGATTKAPDFVKANIDKSLGLGKRKRGFLFFGLLALIAGGGITAMVLLNNNSSADAVQNNYTEQPQELAQNTTNAESETTGVPSSDASFTTAENSSNTSDYSAHSEFTDDDRYFPNNELISNSNESSNLTKNPQLTGSKNLLTRLTTFVNPSIATNLNKVDQNKNKPGDKSLENDEDDTVASTDMDDTNSLTENKNSSVKIENGTNTNNASALATANDASLSNEGENNLRALNNNNDASNDLAQNPDAQNPIDEANDSIVNNAPNAIASTQNDPIADTTSNNSAAIDTSGSVINDPNAPINRNDDEKYKPWMLSLTSGINLVSAAYNSSNMDEIILYDNATNERLGNQTNLDITYRFKNGLSFGTGLGVVNYSEAFNFTTTNYSIDSIKNVDYEYDYLIITDLYDTIPVESLPSGPAPFTPDTILIPVDSTVTYTYEETVSSTNHLGANKASYFILPLRFGTQMRFNKFQLDIFASSRFNFLMRSSGGYQTGNEFIPFDKTNTIYKKFYVDVMLGTRAHYNIWKNLYASGSIQYRPVLGNAYTGLTFNKSFDYVHFGLGLSLRF